MTPIRLFLLIAFAFTWTCFGVLHLMGGLTGAGQAVAPLMILAMFGPALAAFICAQKYDAGRRAEALGLMVPDWSRLAFWLPFAWLLPVLMAAASAALTLYVLNAPPVDPAARFAEAVRAAGQNLPAPPEAVFRLQLMIGVPAGILINTAILTFSEELGWRGWLQPRLSHLGFWKMSLAVGLIWGVWHAPVILMGYNYPGLGWGGVAAMIALCVLFTPYLALLRERGAGAWGPGALHGSLNAVTGVSFLWLPSLDWPHMGLLGLEGFALLLSGWGLIWAYRRWRPMPQG